MANYDYVGRYRRVGVKGEGFESYLYIMDTINGDVFKCARAGGEWELQISFDEIVDDEDDEDE